MDRRSFLKSTAVLAAGTAFTDAALAQEGTASQEKAEPRMPAKLITSAPMLQNYAETSMGVAFTVSALASGYVIYGRQSDLSDGVKVKCGGYRVTDLNSDVMLIRLTGLEPATKYYYRIGADCINYVHGHRMMILGTEEDPRIYSFTTAGKDAKAHFCVINDTHKSDPVFDRLTEKIAAIAPSCVVWNGDTMSHAEDIETLKETLFYPEIKIRDYASETPYLLSCGNHDVRGLAARHYERAWMFRQPEERSSRDWDLGRCFAVRMGDVAMIGLDTGEDKVDTNPIFCNLFNSEPYREAQAKWLEDALRRPEIASAPYIVAFCHIPLHDADPGANPGDIHPADKDPRYRLDYAEWQRYCYQLWGPLLENAGCQLLVCGHTHTYRRDDPCEAHSWTMLVGGGPSLDSETDFATVIEGKVEGGRLDVTVHNAATGKVVDSVSIAPRKKRSVPKIRR